MSDDLVSAIQERTEEHRSRPSLKYTTFSAVPGSTHERVVELVPLGARVLEFGCATGYMSEVLTGSRGCSVTGIEISQEAAELADEHCEQVVVGDADELDYAALFAGREFDCLLFADVLEHLRAPADVLRRVRPLITEQGSVVASIPNVAHGSVRLALLAGDFRYRDLGLLDEGHLRFFTRESIQDMFEESGYIVTDWIRQRVAVEEAEVRPSAPVPPAARALVDGDPEGTTYQFIVRAVPSGAASQVAVLRGLLEEARGELDELRPEVQRLQKEVEQQAARLAETVTAGAEKDRQLQELQQVAEGRRQQIEQQAARLEETVTAGAEKDRQLQELQQVAEGRRQQIEQNSGALRDAHNQAEQHRQAAEREAASAAAARTEAEREAANAAAARTEAERLQQMVDEGAQLLDEATEELTRLTEAVGQETARAHEASAEAERLRRLAAETSSSAQGAEAELEQLQRIVEDERRRLQRAERDLEDLGRTVQGREEEARALQRRLDAGSKREADLREMILDANEQLLQQEEQAKTLLEAELKPRDEEIRWLRGLADARDLELTAARAHIAEIESTRLWRVGRRYWRLKSLGRARP
jgi:2-polyprenyl-3-methyl-5-hydroxy-6-metoxy-1,4-benzoquinol methylase